MIICDTTSANTGRGNGVIVQLQNDMVRLGFEKPQCVRHHLKHVLNFFIHYTSKRPEIEYCFITELNLSYKQLQINYEANEYLEGAKNHGWRADFKFLYDL